MTIITPIIINPIAVAVDLPYTVLGGTPLVEEAAEGSTSALDTQQRAAEIGEVIPIVFCRRVGETGGILISPPATEARFEDASPSGDVTAHYHLVLSEGQIDPIQVRDVFQRACRVGSYTQTYNRRAGTFTPGNFIDNSPNLEAPYYCGTGGSYAGMSTMAFNVTIPAGFDQWNRQVHCFIRGGMHVTRLLDSTLGPSNNVVDLLLYLLRNGSKLADAQIDTTALTNAARFTDANGFWFNGVVSESTNLRDWMSGILPYYLLRSTRIGGKEALRPLLPYVASTGAIDTGPVSWVFTFTEEHIVPGSFQITYTPLADRKPFCVLVMWRQQPTDDIGLIRSTEVRYAGTALDGPFEQHDLSGFCASEDHAVKVGTYILARRKHITHRLGITVRPDAFNETLVVGDLVRVRLERTPSSGAASVHNELYEVDRIGKSLSGEVQLELTQFPVDDQLRSVVALEVNSATGAGILLSTGKTGVTCDINLSSDTSVPAEAGMDVPEVDGAYDVDVTQLDAHELEDSDDGITPASVSGGGGWWRRANPEDAIGGQSLSAAVAGVSMPFTYSGDSQSPEAGDTVTAGSVCAGQYTEWWRLDPSGNTVPLDPNDPAGTLLAQNTNTYTFVIDDVDYAVFATVACPDPSSPTGYSQPIALGATPVIRDPLPDYICGTGTYTSGQNSEVSRTYVIRYKGVGGNCNVEDEIVDSDSTYAGPTAPVKSARFYLALATTQCGGGFRRVEVQYTYLNNTTATATVAQTGGGPITSYFVVENWRPVGGGVGTNQMQDCAP